MLRILQEKYREIKEVHNHGLRKFGEGIGKSRGLPSELIWWCIRKKVVHDVYDTTIQDMYNDCETLVSTIASDKEYFSILTMDVQQAEIGKEPQRVMLFAYDLVICEHSRAQVELQLERCRVTFESHGLRVFSLSSTTSLSYYYVGST